jgi:hypothetical protein
LNVIVLALLCCQRVVDYYRFWGVREFCALSSLKENAPYKLGTNNINILASILGIIPDFIIFLETESEATAGCR